MTELAEAPDRYEVPAAFSEERQAFRVLNDDMATWAMRKARDVARQRLEIARTAAEEIERIRAWVTKQDEQLQHDAQFFTGLLTDYALMERAINPRRKSIVTPYGTVSTRAGQRKWAIDEVKALEWAKAHHPELIEVTEKVPASSVKDAVEVVDGRVIDPVTGETLDWAAISEGTVGANVEPDLS